jgi:hypothetical protein
MISDSTFNKKNFIASDDWFIRDETAFTTYDKKNFAKLKKIFLKINELQDLRDYNARLCLEHRCKMSEAEYWGKMAGIQALEQQIDKIYEDYVDTPIWRKQNDQTQLPDSIEPIDSRLKQDRITLSGIVVFNQQIMAQSTTKVFSYMGAGEGLTAAGPNDSGLGIEITRVNIKASGGNMKATGVTLRWDAMIDILTETFTCTEAALFNGPANQSGVICGARSVLDSSQGVDHTYGNDFLYVRMLAQTLSA